MKTLEVYITALAPDEFPDYDIEASEDAFIAALQVELDQTLGKTYEVTIGTKAHPLADSVLVYDQEGTPFSDGGYINDLVAHVIDEVHNRFDWLVELDTTEYPEDIAIP